MFRSQRLNRRLRRFSPTCLGVHSNWTSHGRNRGAELGLIGVIGVIGGSNWVDWVDGA